MEKFDKKGFNLLRPQLTPEDRWDKIYNWINSTARVIVIFVELIVIVCFVIRVAVDRKARDLEEILENNKLRLETLVNTENDLRKLQSRLNTYQGIWEQSNSFTKYIDEIYDYNPRLVPLITISINETGTLSVSGKASNKDVNDLESKIKNSNSFRDVQLISFKPDDNSETSDASFQIEAKIIDFKRKISITTNSGA